MPTRRRWKTNDTAEGRQKNRRVDIVILNQTGIKGEPERPMAQETIPRRDARKEKK
jgi:hypothetical protein